MKNPYLILFGCDEADDMASLLQIIAAHSETHGMSATLGVLDHSQTLLRHELIKQYDKVINPQPKTANLDKGGKG